MKIAVAGKGGSGKTVVASTLARLLAREGFDVIAVDADASLNLAPALGVSEDIRRSLVPLTDRKDIITERTAAAAGVFRLNPVVKDLVDEMSVEAPDGVRLMAVGTVRDAGSGCMCPANALLRSLMRHLVLGEKSVVIMDMEAGLEHLGRSTIKGVDLLIIVTEPSVKSVEVSAKIAEMSKELGVKKIMVIGNKIRSDAELEFLRTHLSRHSLNLVSTMPFDESVIEADRVGVPPLDFDSESKAMLALRHAASLIHS